MKKTIVYLGMALVSFIGTTTAATINPSKFPTEAVAGGTTPLCTAISKGETEIVKKFVEYGVDVNEKSNGLTPLMIAARYNRAEIIEFLLSKGADPSIKNENGLTALKFAESSNATESVAVLTNFKRK